MDPTEAFQRFMQDSAIAPSKDMTIAFFVGYSFGGNATMEQLDRVVEEFKAQYKVVLSNGL